MIEITIKNHMAERLGVPIFFEFPSRPPGTFVVLKVSGNGRENLLDAATLVADSYGTSLLATAELNDRVKTAMDELADLPQISSSRRAGDYPVFDTQNKKHRYQAVQNITHY